VSETTFKDAESFLEELGVERRPIVVKLPDAEADAEAGAADAAVAAGDAGAELSDGVPLDGEHTESDSTAAQLAQDGAPMPPLDEAISAAVATVRRITAAAPVSEGRVRRKLEKRELPGAVVRAAMQRARDERLVDDDALAAALVAEWRAKGHAPTRLRADLRKREFDETIVERAVTVAEDDEPLAAAFALAKDRAQQMRHVEAETAYRRIVGYLARRGHSDGVSRKAARDAVFDDRERERTAGH
jgi:regulatory protein